jgi:hypothetical protein
LPSAPTRPQVARRQVEQQSPLHWPQVARRLALLQRLLSCACSHTGKASCALVACCSETATTTSCRWLLLIQGINTSYIKRITGVATALLSCIRVGEQGNAQDSEHATKQPLASVWLVADVAQDCVVAGEQRHQPCGTELPFKACGSVARALHAVQAPQHLIVVPHSLLNPCIS